VVFMIFNSILALEPSINKNPPYDNAVYSNEAIVPIIIESIIDMNPYPKGDIENPAPLLA